MRIDKRKLYHLDWYLIINGLALFAIGMVKRPLHPGHETIFPACSESQVMFNWQCGHWNSKFMG